MPGEKLPQPEGDLPMPDRYRRVGRTLDQSGPRRWSAQTQFARPAIVPSRTETLRRRCEREWTAGKWPWRYGIAIRLRLRGLSRPMFPQDLSAPSYNAAGYAAHARNNLAIRQPAAGADARKRDCRAPMRYWARPQELQATRVPHHSDFRC